METKTIGIGIILLLITLTGCQMNSPETPLQKKQEGVPQNVLQDYQDVKNAFENQLGSSLQMCRKGQENIYVIIGSGSYHGQASYYDAEGKLLHTDSASDVSEPETSLDLKTYDCVTLLSEDRPLPQEEFQLCSNPNPITGEKMC
ncbi:MAG: hypothetical protein WC595_04820 [Candidatus Nanoarchaeia archaeon]